MITPASVGDWVMFDALVGALGTAAAVGYRFILTEEREEPVAAKRPAGFLPNLAEASFRAGAADRGERVGPGRPVKARARRRSGLRGFPFAHRQFTGFDGTVGP